MTVARPASALVSLALAVAALAAFAACTAAPPPDPGATQVPPMATPSQAVAAAAALVEAELVEAGFELAPSPVEHRPGEPDAVQDAPRAIYRVNLAEPGEGWVLIYDLGSPDAAQAAGQAFAAFLGSGVGQTNYPRDAQFALSRAGSALVFSYWSRERSGDPELAQAAFEAIRDVGQQIEVRR